MPTLYAAAALVVSVGAAVAATMLLHQVDRLSPGRRLGRRALLLLSAAATAALAATPRHLLAGGAPILSVLLVMGLCIITSVLHYVRQTRLPTYLTDVTLIWLVWIAGNLLVRWRWSWGLILVTLILWVIFTMAGILGVYPSSRRHLRRGKQVP